MLEGGWKVIWDDNFIYIFDRSWIMSVCFMYVVVLISNIVNDVLK